MTAINLQRHVTGLFHVPRFDPLVIKSIVFPSFQYKRNIIFVRTARSKLFYGFFSRCFYYSALQPFWLNHQCEIIYLPPQVLIRAHLAVLVLEDTRVDPPRQVVEILRDLAGTQLEALLDREVLQGAQVKTVLL